jgi:uncharacterized protein (DUF1501 family)
MSRVTDQSRRAVLRLGLRAAAACGLTGVSATAAPSSNRAAVCLYLIGGNDSNNMIVPLDSPAYDAYAKGRGPLAIPRDALLAVDSNNPSAKYGFHPSMAGLQGLYNRGALAVLANVGRNTAPLTAAAVKANSASVPNDLFEHIGASNVRYIPNGYLTLEWAPQGNRQPVAQLERGITMTPSETAPVRGARPRPFSTQFPNTNTGRGLQSVANQLRSGALGGHLFVCPTVGFDTHGNQLARQAALFTELNDALVAFYSAMEELGIADRVTLFTQSEFDRTLAPNDRGGTEHAWGGHQLIMGGSVFGSRVHGTFPSLELGGADDLGQSGTWIPTTSNVQYDATIAQWLGRTNLASLPGFENLNQFFPANLGFLTA